jgi:hypothetical protein
MTAAISADVQVGIYQSRDGDLSRREFLGTLEEFRQCKGDGLVSPA